MRALTPATSKGGTGAFAPLVSPTRGRVLQRKCDCGRHAGGGDCEECKRKSSGDPLLQRSALNRSTVSEAPPIVHDVLRSSGQALDAATRSYFEPRFGRDFSGVRVHVGRKAAESARAVNALAYAVGSSLVFGEGQYAPGAASGKALLAHELTHVVQQDFGRSASSGPLRVTSSNDGAEREASQAESALRAGQAFAATSGHARRLARYGHSWSCKDVHLGPFIWPGHAYAKKIVDKAIDLTDGRPIDSSTKRTIESLFGSGSTDPSKLQTINGNFKKIRKALDEQYNYHCSGKDAPPDKEAIACKGQNAETDQSGSHDITLCFDRIRTWWPGGMSGPAWLIVHENFHRGVAFGHGWQAGEVGDCILHPPNPSPPDLNNADAYACSAVILDLPVTP
jgi:hypothetical protein